MNTTMTLAPAAGTPFRGRWLPASTTSAANATGRTTIRRHAYCTLLHTWSLEHQIPPASCCSRSVLPCCSEVSLAPLHHILLRRYPHYIPLHETRVVSHPLFGVGTDRALAVSHMQYHDPDSADGANILSLNAVRASCCCDSTRIVCFMDAVSGLSVSTQRHSYIWLVCTLPFWTNDQ